MTILLDRARRAIDAKSPDSLLIAELAAELETVTERCHQYVLLELEARRDALETLRRSQFTIKHLRAHRDALVPFNNNERTT